jgi:hypothetical protein
MQIKKKYTRNSEGPEGSLLCSREATTSTNNNNNNNNNNVTCRAVTMDGVWIGELIY